MKISTSEKEIHGAIEALDLSSQFNTDNLHFEIRTYEKNEQIVSPIKPLTNFVFVLSGSVRIYYLDEDSTIHTITNIGSGEIMGYDEFAFGSDIHTLYAESVTRTKVLIMPFRQHSRSLKNDNRFLLFLLKKVLNTQSQRATMNTLYNELEDKLLFYIENICENKTIDNVSTAVTAMGCSRRQLQRILKKLCDDGTLTHEKRGRYILN